MAAERSGAERLDSCRCDWERRHAAEGMDGRAGVTGHEQSEWSLREQKHAGGLAGWLADRCGGARRLGL